MPLAYSRLPMIAAAVPTKMAMLLRRAALEVELRAKQAAPVDTGHLRASISMSGGGLRYVVTAAAAYSIYVELGTRKMSAQPYLVPSLRQAWPGLIAALRGLV